MKFRLFYEGLLESAQRDPKGGQTDKKADHKHEIRCVLHRQLRELWTERRFLKEAMTTGEVFGHPGERKRLREKLVEISPVINGYRFVPIVHGKLDLLCDLKVLIMRRDRPGKGFSPRDIDNRLKVLFDALKMPASVQELGNNRPELDDNPVFVLLEKDELISSVTVETDDLLDVPPDKTKDDAYARVLMEVTITPFNVNMFNLGFA